MSDNLQVYDANSALRLVKTTDNAGVHTPHHNVDEIGALPPQHVDAFSRLRISQPRYLFDSQFTYRLDSDLWDEKPTGDGAITYNPTDRKVALTVGTTAGANSAILQSHYHAPYIPGRSQLIFATWRMTTATVTNGEIGVGYYDGSNGIYLLNNAAGLSLNIASTTSSGNQSVAQTNWNVDPLDGTGPSGITLDVSKTQILVINLQALYVGMVTVAFDIDGRIVVAHQFKNANNLTAPYIATANLPVRYWVSNSTGSAQGIDAICASVMSEGGDNLDQLPGRNFGVTASDVDGGTVKLLAIRCKPQLNGINQNVITIPIGTDVVAEDAGTTIRVILGADIISADGTFTDVDPASSMEYATSESGLDFDDETGQVVDIFYVPAANKQQNTAGAEITGKAIMAYSHLLGEGDTLCVLSTGGTATNVYASLKWREIR